MFKETVDGMLLDTKRLIDEFGDVICHLEIIPKYMISNLISGLEMHIKSTKEAIEYYGAIDRTIKSYQPYEQLKRELAKEHFLMTYLRDNI